MSKRIPVIEFTQLAFSVPVRSPYDNMDVDLERAWVDPGFGNGEYLHAPCKHKGDTWEKAADDDICTRIYPPVMKGQSFEAMGIPGRFTCTNVGVLKTTPGWRFFIHAIKVR